MLNDDYDAVCDVPKWKSEVPEILKLTLKIDCTTIWLVDHNGDLWKPEEECPEFQYYNGLYELQPDFDRTVTSGTNKRLES